MKTNIIFYAIFLFWRERGRIRILRIVLDESFESVLVCNTFMIKATFMTELDKMLEMARKAMEQAYAPYSRFKVGAVIRSDSGRLYAGCNVENASYPVGSCAEQGAISAMILGGDTKIADIVVMGDGENLVSPCGACRQRIREFSTPETRVLICDRNGVRKTMTLAELLPVSFGPENLS